MNKLASKALLLSAALVTTSSCALILGDFEPGGTTSGTAGSGTGATGGHGGHGGDGAGPSCVDPAADCPMPSTACVVAACEGGACVTNNAAASTPCTDNGGKVCDGSGACVQCGGVDDCPAPANECITATCTAGVCGTMNVADGIATATGQIAGDCKKIACDGAGATKTIDDATDVEDDAEACTADSCAGGAPVHVALTGSDCAAEGPAPAHLCAASGKCVECLVPADCVSNVCQSNACQPAGCGDGVKNGNETAKDCGGGTCGACADNLTCNVASDCQSGVCPTGTCKTATCSDGVKNPNNGETDVDCGGSCVAAPNNKKCAFSKGCGVNTDCIGGSCVGNVCAATCSDTVQNGAESDIDCGAACGAAKLCPALKKCGNANDCQSGVCTLGICQTASCGDLVKNGTETDVDCGGSCAGAPSNKKCAYNKGCLAGTDCLGGSCVANKCAATCTDTVKNGTESDIDCGGAGCPQCYFGKACGAATDCKGGACTASTCDVTSMATGQKEPWGVAVDANYIFWTNYAASTVMRMPIGGGNPLTFVTGQSGATDIVRDSTNDVYWITSTAVRKIATVGGALTTIKTGISPSDIASNGVEMFFTDYPVGDVYRGPVAGVPFQMVNAQGGPWGVGASPTHACWVNQTAGQVYVTKLSDGSIPVNLNVPGAVDCTLDATFVYYITGGGSIVKAPIAGGAQTTLASGLGTPLYLEVDATHVYWTEFNGGIVAKAPIAGGGPITTIAKSQLGPYGMTIDATYIYWANRNVGTSAGSIARSLK